LAWSRGAGAETCIDARDLATKVEATIGRPVATVPPLSNPDAPVDAASLHLEGEVRPLGSGWIAIVEVRAAGPSLRREVALEGPDCRQFDEGLVLVVALLTEAALPTAPRLTLQPSPSPRASVGIGPDLSFAWGMLPRLAVGFGLATEAALPPLWHLAAWTHAWPISEAVDDGATVARFYAWTIGGGPCVGPAGREPRAFFGCAGVSGGVVYSTGAGRIIHTSLRPYMQAELRAGLRLRLDGPIFVRLEVGAGLPVARDSYYFTPANGVPKEVFRTAPVVALGRFAVEFRAP
jgi:hypothetical protein